LIGGDFCFPRQRRTAAGVAQLGGVLREITQVLFHCEIKQKEGIIGCARMEEEG
jgi:hypothetical protein